VYLIALEIRFWSNRRNKRRSDSTASEQGTNVQLQSPLLRERRELDFELAQQLIHPKVRDFRLHSAGIESRNVKQRPEISSTASREASILPTSWASCCRRLAFDQASDVKARGVERCRMSWLAAARKRVLEMLACSASPLARPSSVLRRVSSSVRSVPAAPGTHWRVRAPPPL
jgi:hypothetical protein